MSETLETVDTAPDLAVPPADAAERVAAGATLIDVRSPGGRAASGLLVPGAVVVDRTDVDGSFADAAPKDVPVVVICGSVNGSGPIARHLSTLGFDVHHVDGGVPAWHEANLPTTTA